MPKPKRGPRLGAGPAHQKLMLSNLATALFVHGRIRTTVAKAKALRPYAERLITKAKRGDLHARRQVLAKLRDRDVVAYLFEEVAPRFADRPGGYTRIIRVGPRPGDNAPMAVIELVEQAAPHAGETYVEEGRRRRARRLFGRFRRSAPPPRPAAAVEETAADRASDEAVEATETAAGAPESAGPPETADAAEQTDGEAETDEAADPELREGDDEPR